MLSPIKSYIAVRTFLQISFFIFLLTQICFAQGSWTQIGDMPEIRLAHTANELDGKIYIVGGADTEQGQDLTTMLVYDRAETTWTTIPLLNNEFRVQHTSSDVDSKLYIIGGWTTDGSNYVTSSKVDMYDPNTGLWTSKNPMPTDRANLASALIDGKIYVMGGLRTFDFTGLKTLEVYDVASDTWDTTKADMPTKRWGHSAVAVNGKIYVIGGTTITPNFAYASVEVYDPQTDTWTTKSNMPTPRYQLTTCVLNNNIYAIDGWLDSGNGPIYDKVEVYNPESDTWYTETPMPVARALLASIVLDGKIQVFGGSSTLHPLIGSSGIYEFSNNEPLPAGTYTIGSGGYFSSIQSSFDKLSTDGVAGNVTLELIDELYTAPSDTFGFLLDGPITGAGPNSRITIKPAENKNVTLEGNWGYVVTFRNVSYLTFDGISTEGSTTLTIHSLYNSQYITNRGIGFLANSDHNVAQNLIVICDDITRTGIGIFFRAFENSLFAPDSNLIQNNFIKKAACGIDVSAYFASTNTRHTGNIIKGNKVGSETDSLIAWGIQIEKSQSTIIENNIVQNMTFKNGYNYDNVNKGINSYWGNGDIIRNNIVHDIKGTGGNHATGIQLSGDAGYVGDNNLIYNNMVYNIQSTSTQSDSRVAGIQIWQQNNPKIYYNSAYLSGTGSNHSGSAAFYIHHSCTNVEAKNNILVNTRDESPYSATAIYDYTASNLTSDYNDLYSDNYLVRIGNTNYNTLTDWQTTGKDLHSYVEMPHFISSTDLHIDESIATYLESRGTPISGIDTDFDGDTRSAATPDIGADEFDGIVGVEKETSLPTEFSLLQNFPNPFNPTTTIKYQIPKISFVMLKVYDVLGNEIATIINEEKPIGSYEIEFNATNFPSGVYFYQLRAGEFIQTKKMLLLK